jgi:hypothetical protein
MGLFSWNCKGCGHPALSKDATSPINAWMKQVVIIEKSGDRHSGEYDGYGRAGSYDYAGGDGADPCLRHEACWEAAGRPAHDGASDPAPDQGWFFDEGEHDAPDPRR